MKKEVKESIRKYALRNALQHDGEADTNAVLGGVMSDHDVEPKEIIEKVQKIVAEVNKLSKKDQEDEAEEMDVVLETEKEESEGLPELPEEEEGNVITRAAPNPNGPFHLGNSRAYILSYIYANRNDGRFILRYDDTNPSSPEKSPKKKFYRWIEEDLEWLGCKPDLIIRASERLDIYYEFAYELIEDEKAYVCTCNPDKWKKLRDEGKACPCRSKDSEEHVDRWHKMQDGDYEEGEAVVRIKTDIEHKDPAQRDWPAFRILKDHNHPHVSQDYVVWPLYNFASAVDDHELNVTHIFRAEEHSTNTENQKHLYDHLGWEYPNTAHHGFLSLKGAVLSTSTIRNGINNGKYSGWDDPRLGTIRALRRRGFQPEAIHRLIKKYGIKSSNAEVSMEEFTSINRKVVDPEALRYFFVKDPIKLKVKDPGKKGTVKLTVHPEKEGERELEVGNTFFIEREDFESNRGKTIRLKGLYNIEIPEKGKDCKYSGDDIVQKMPKVHWLPDKEGETVEAEVVMPSAERKEGIAERNVLEEEVGNVLQFERFGFVRLDDKEDLTFYFTHK
ncbi:MAG: glutamate--tRNA ligase [Candidatus Aenigmatarchaeota archaeon]